MSVGSTILVGTTSIPYTVRFSPRAQSKQIIVTPAGVEVVVPDGTPSEGSEGVAEFLQRKRRWIYKSLKEVETRSASESAQQYASGAKVQYRGRWLMLDIVPGPTSKVRIALRSKFRIEVPEGLALAERPSVVAEALQQWMRARAHRDMEAFTRRHSQRLGVTPKAARLSDSKHAWGTCGLDDIVRVHWRLIQAPKIALEYVTAHEIAHLVHRNHSPEFWQTLSLTMPNWQEAKAILERWEGEPRAV